MSTGRRTERSEGPLLLRPPPPILCCSRVPWAPSAPSVEAAVALDPDPAIELEINQPLGQARGVGVDPLGQRVERKRFVSQRSKDLALERVARSRFHRFGALGRRAWVRTPRRAQSEVFEHSGCTTEGLSSFACMFDPTMPGTMTTGLRAAGCAGHCAGSMICVDALHLFNRDPSAWQERSLCNGHQRQCDPGSQLPELAHE